MIKTLLALLFRKRFLCRPLTGNGNSVALTFDDGPHGENTPRILDILRSRDIRATFFLLGSEIEKYPGLVSDIRAGGHEIANHGYSHKKSAELGYCAYREDLLKSERLLGTGPAQRRPLFRPPFGELNLSILRLLFSTDIVLAYWTVDSMDSFIRDPEKLQNRMNEVPVRAGDILLFHEDYKATVAALPNILDALKNRGFLFLKMSEMTGNIR